MHTLQASGCIGLVCVAALDSSFSVCFILALQHSISLSFSCSFSYMVLGICSSTTFTSSLLLLLYFKQFSPQLSKCGQAMFRGLWERPVSRDIPRAAPALALSFHYARHSDALNPLTTIKNITLDHLRDEQPKTDELCR